MPPLATYDVDLDVAWHRILKHNKGQFEVFYDVSTNIGHIQMSPILTNYHVLEQMFSCSDAVIISAYGMGNLPIDNEHLMGTIRKAVDDGVLIVVTTQCYHGTVSDVYATGRYLTDMGCILAHDMTVECIFAKLGYLIGKVSSLIETLLLKVRE